MTRTHATLSVLLILSAFILLFGWALLPLIHSLPSVNLGSWPLIHWTIHTAVGRWVVGLTIGSLLMGTLSLRK